MTQQMENRQASPTDQPSSLQRSDSREMHELAQLGLQRGATMRDIETAYWGFARDMRGQAGIAPYTQAYEALVNRVKTRVSEAPQAPTTTQETPDEVVPTSLSPGSKFGWPAT